MRVEDVNFDFEPEVTGPIPFPAKKIHLDISEENLFGDFAHAFCAEVWRKVPLRAEQLDLSEKEVSAYVSFLVAQRVLSVQGNCPLWRKLKVLYIPAWIQFNLRLIGEVIYREKGLIITPEYEKKTIKFEEAVVISEKIGSLMDSFQIVRDAMPRGIEGDPEVMSMALVAGYVSSFKEEKIPGIKTYVTRFLGMKIREEAVMKEIYRSHYDDVDYIRNALITDKRILA